MTAFGLNPKILLKKSRFLALALLDARDSEMVLYIFLALSQSEKTSVAVLLQNIIIEFHNEQNTVILRCWEATLPAGLDLVSWVRTTLFSGVRCFQGT